MSRLNFYSMAFVVITVLSTCIFVARSIGTQVKATIVSTSLIENETLVYYKGKIYSCQGMHGKTGESLTVLVGIGEKCLAIEGHTRAVVKR